MLATADAAHRAKLVSDIAVSDEPKNTAVSDIAVSLMITRWGCCAATVMMWLMLCQLPRLLECCFHTAPVWILLVDNATDQRRAASVLHLLLFSWLFCRTACMLSL